MNRGFLPVVLATVCGVATAVAAFDPAFKEQQRKKFSQDHPQPQLQSLPAGAANARDSAFPTHAPPSQPDSR
ncbi:hypothetical protein GQ43DRAFT_441497 [Delitschia confertaspora ATCC 74209]|uniref:Tat pathway signal sequence domain protein n=1 Tax=Delitschia confertaspora ATCC 74209 TaxID=1513339 RepID=A0A9P4JLR9_9PLEO|nr:hypothetical protein GQ43DRAFT_441497 [Delitschia confertaspora ATCC 74209]